ncbi:MAG: terminase large subunit [Spirochaetota bacterium]
MARRLLPVVLLIVGMATVTAAQYTAEKYIKDVLNDRIPVCRYVHLAVERHVGDLDRVGSEDFPYHFDEYQATRAIDFKQQLRHTQGEYANPRLHDTRIRLEPWQQFIDWCVFGWRRADGMRRFTRVYVEVARKNGKTTNAAATANYCYFADRPHEEGPEVYAVATARDQAKKSWDEADRQIQRQPVLRKLVRTYRSSNTITVPGTASVFRPLSRDSKSLDGLNAHFILVDEYHAHPTDAMLQVLVDSTVARSQPLTYIITTAGFDLNGPCFRERDRVITTLERAVKRSDDDPVDESTFGIIFTLDEGDDWTDEAVWPKANPNLGVSVRPERLREQVQIALSSPHKQNDVKTKHFNVWTQAETRWITDEKWMRCEFAVRPQDLVHRPAWIGLDLSASVDLSSYVICVPPEGELEKYSLIPRFFIPGDNIIDRERRDKVPYQYWVEKGLIHATPGDVIDYDFIEQCLLEDAERFELREIAFDPWKAQEIVNHFTDAGFTMVPIYQRYSGMAAPSDTFEKMVLAQQIAHGGNPVLRWNMSCTEVKSDRQGNIMPMKPQRDKNGKRIDGIVASIMALHRAVLGTGEQASIYQTRGIITI